jgi:hypothetical protein
MKNETDCEIVLWFTQAARTVKPLYKLNFFFSEFLELRQGSDAYDIVSESFDVKQQMKSYFFLGFVI